MLRRLRVKFIALSMTVVALVLAITFTVVCALDCQQSVDGVYRALSQAIEDSQNLGWLHFDDEQFHDDQQSENEPQGTPPRIGGGPREDSSLPVAVYYLSADGTMAMASPRSTAAIDGDALSAALAQLGTADRIHALTQTVYGKLANPGLFFALKETPLGFVAAFADASAASSWESLALTLLLVGIGVLGAFLVLTILFARWALRPVETAWIGQQRFIADASHELKTPLTVILANTSIVKAHPERTVAEQAQWIESTEIEAKRMQSLVGDLLTLMRLQEGAGGDGDKETVDFSDLVEGEVLQFESVAFEHDLTLENAVQPGLVVAGQRVQLQRLCAILLDNACKHGQAGTAVSVKLARHGRRVRLSVHNVGAAIPPRDLPHVFDRFYQVDTARSGGGFGLGLAIARETAERLGGTLEVESRPDAGTTFTATLPLARP